MKKLFGLSLTLFALTDAPGAFAKMNSADMSATRSLFQSSGCTSCHDATGSAAGPSLKAIAKRYKGKPVITELAQRIREGSQGRWGDLSHPTIDYLSPTDSSMLAEWILNGAH
jgi:cytochrome c551/c552